MASLALQHQKARGVLSLSSAERLLAACTYFFVGFSFGKVLFQVVFFYACCPPLRGRLAAIMVMRSRDFSLALAVLHTFDMASLALQHKKGQGVFHSAALKDCCVVELATLLFLFFWGFLFQVLWALRPSMGDTLRLRPRRAASRLQTDDLTRRSRLLPCTLAVLHAVDVASLALQHKNVRRGDSVAQAALKTAGCVELPSSLFSCVLFVLFQVVSFFIWLRPSTGPVAWVPFGRVGWRRISRAKRQERNEKRSAMMIEP